MIRMNQYIEIIAKYQKKAIAQNPVISQNKIMIAADTVAEFLRKPSTVTYCICKSIILRKKLYEYLHVHFIVFRDEGPFPVQMIVIYCIPSLQRKLCRYIKPDFA